MVSTKRHWGWSFEAICCWRPPAIKAHLSRSIPCLESPPVASGVLRLGEQGVCLTRLFLGCSCSLQPRDDSQMGMMAAHNTWDAVWAESEGIWTLLTSSQLCACPALLSVPTGQLQTLQLLSWIIVLFMRSISFSPRSKVFTIIIRILWGFALTPISPCWSHTLINLSSVNHTVLPSYFCQKKELSACLLPVHKSVANIWLLI